MEFSSYAAANAFVLVFPLFYVSKLVFSCNKKPVYLSWITLWYVCLSSSSVVTCYTPQNVTNGKSLWDSERRPTYGETVHYSCNKGYVLVGKSSTKCTKTGEYDSEPPKCKGKHSTSMCWTCWLSVSINAIKAPFQLFSYLTPVLCSYFCSSACVGGSDGPAAFLAFYFNIVKQS